MIIIFLICNSVLSIFINAFILRYVSINTASLLICLNYCIKVQAGIKRTLVEKLYNRKNYSSAGIKKILKGPAVILASGFLNPILSVL